LAENPVARRAHSGFDPAQQLSAVAIRNRKRLFRMGGALSFVPHWLEPAGEAMALAMRAFLSLAALVFAAFAAPAMAQPVRTANVEAELHAARAAVAPGERFTVVLRQTIREGWHTYWRNPGDSGLPTELDWRAPPGWRMGEIQWPAPQALPFASLVNYGYSGEVLFPIEAAAPANAGVGESITLSADAHWLVCSDVCIPEDAVVTLTLPIAARGRDDPVWAPRIAAAIAALPRRAPGMDARVTAGAPGTLSVVLPNAGELRNPRFFPFSRDAMLAAAAQHPRIGPAGLSFSLTPGADGALGHGPLDGVVAYDIQQNGAWVRRGVEISAQPGDVLAGTSERPAPISDDYALAELEGGGGAVTYASGASLDTASLLLAIALAFLGGLILNLMPCVLPVLSMKALTFAGGVQAGKARRHGVLYFAGVSSTFLVLALALIALRGAGEAIGWGFQLQAPWVTSALALVFFVIGLNLLGVFHVGRAMQNAGAGLSASGGDAGAFFTGALAVIAATPCTAPFMAGAIGVAITQSALTTLLIFASLGLGFAAPLTALHFVPGLQSLIPKPGAWMERVRNVLAFPMFGAAIWLIWVFAEQTGAAGVLALLSIAAALAFALFVARWGRAWLIVGALALALTAAFAWRPLVGLEQQAVLVSEPWSPARVEQVRGEGRGVFVNFTAAWCVTCKVNEATAFTPRVSRAFEQRGVAYLVADWTNRDDAIAAALAEHGRAGVPLYLYYPPDGEPRVLPQLLSERLILEAIGAD
jgi:thiol:disulfide interchange protein DsbD